MKPFAEQVSRDTRTDLIGRLDQSARELGLLLDHLMDRMELDDRTEDDLSESLDSLWTGSQYLKERCRQISQELDWRDEQDVD